MLKKVWLCHNINKFYKIFGEALEVHPCKTRLRDLKDSDFLLGVQFDVLEAVEAHNNIFDDKVYPIDRWLNKLLSQLIA